MTDEVNLPIPPGPVGPAEPVAPPAAGATPATSDADAEGGAPARDPNKVYTQDEVDRIAKKVKQNARDAAKREAKAHYEGRLAGMQSAPVVQPTAPEPTPEVKPPTRDQFGSYEEFLDAKAQFTGSQAAEKRMAERDAAEKTRIEQETAGKLRDTFRSKLTEKYPDIVERAADIGNIVIPDHLVSAIHESEHGPDIFNGFVDNPKELERVMALSPSAALREIGRLEARLEAAIQKPDPTPAPAAQAAPAASRAPTPIRPVTPSAVKGDDEPSHDKPDEWRRWRDRQVAAKRRAGG